MLKKDLYLCRNRDIVVNILITRGIAGLRNSAEVNAYTKPVYLDENSSIYYIIDNFFIPQDLDFDLQTVQEWVFARIDGDGNVILAGDELLPMRETTYEELLNETDYSTL